MPQVGSCLCVCVCMCAYVFLCVCVWMFLSDIYSNQTLLINGNFNASNTHYRLGREAAMLPIQLDSIGFTLSISLIKLFTKIYLFLCYIHDTTWYFKVVFSVQMTWVLSSYQENSQTFLLFSYFNLKCKTVHAVRSARSDLLYIFVNFIRNGSVTAWPAVRGTL